MTRIECPSEAWDRYCEDEERANTPTDDELIEQLDAYGHLTWVVGGLVIRMSGQRTRSAAALAHGRVASW